QERFEFEVDTTAANQYWEKEVAENMRRQQEGSAEVSDEQTQYTGMAEVAGEAEASAAEKGCTSSTIRGARPPGTRPTRRAQRVCTRTPTGTATRTPG